MPLFADKLIPSTLAADRKPRPASAFGARRIAMRSRWPEWATLSFYAAIVAFAIPYHEPWADEAQAWQLARSLPLRTLFQTNIRYEGTPGLWHFLLWIMIHAHVSYSGLHWICGAIAVVSVSLLLFGSPFPRYLKLTLPFTYFLLFQYAVIARSYVLVPLLLFAVAYWWKKNALAVAIALGLLANVSLHAAVISGGLALIFFLHPDCIGSIGNILRSRKLLLGAAILLGLYAFAIWTAFPPKDFNFLAHGDPRPFVVRAAIAMIDGMLPPWYLACAFWLVIVLWFRGRRSLFYLLPVLFLVAFSGYVYAEFWHLGLILPLLATLLWITWPEPQSVMPKREIAGHIALACVILLQICWSFYAIRYDHNNAYSPDAAAAQFLRPFVDKGTTIAVTYIGHNDSQAFNDVGILPYFDHNIYANQRDSFWWWSKNNQTERQFDLLLPSHPQIVLGEMVQPVSNQPLNLRDFRVQELQKSGYQLTNVFCGTMPQRLKLWIGNCHLIFQYAADLNSTSDAESPARK